MTPEDLIRHVSGSLWLLPGGGGGVEATLAGAQGERRALLRRVVELYERYDLVVVDGGSHLSSVLAACLAGAERLLALTAPDRVAMAATYALLKVGRERFPSMPMEILVNGGDGITAEEVFRLMSLAGERFLGLKAAFGGSLPRDADLEGLQRKGASLLQLPPSSPALTAAGALHSRLASEQARTWSDSAPVLPLSSTR
jgi:MinD-like ATPase involved in chromosome partitioning or flagellar assembly